MQNDLNTSTTDSQDEKAKSAWQCPTISRIDIKRTMGGVGSAIDLTNGPSLT